jgi:UDP-N-acetylglucosamine/UDP-N-acetylgalactosamine diphosphorylase
VGIVGLIDEKTGVIEYSELSDAECQQQDSKSRLIYRAANTAIHMIHRTFVDATVQHSDALPYHTAVKQVPHLNEQGVLVHPDIANGLKFEMFIFDALAHAKNPITLEVNRETEFAPLKNATGLDSPETVRAALKKNGLA